MGRLAPRHSPPDSPRAQHATTMTPLCFLGLLALAGAACGQQMEVAFSAGLDQHLAVNGNQKVKFDRVFTNVGSGYESTTGVFTCPQSGLYMFNVHALARNDSDMWLELHHNYHYVFSVWGHTDNDYSAASNAALLQLTKGDEVYVVSTEGYYSELYGYPSEVYCTFTGYLVSPISQDFQIGTGGR